MVQTGAASAATPLPLCYELRPLLACADKQSPACMHRETQLSDRQEEGRVGIYM